LDLIISQNLKELIGSTFFRSLEIISAAAQVIATIAAIAIANEKPIIGSEIIGTLAYVFIVIDPTLVEFVSLSILYVK
jgi:hypothetical protein